LIYIITFPSSYIIIITILYTSAYIIYFYTSVTLISEQNPDPISYSYINSIYLLLQCDIIKEINSSVIETDYNIWKSILTILLFKKIVIYKTLLMQVKLLEYRYCFLFSDMRCIILLPVQLGFFVSVVLIIYVAYNDIVLWLSLLLLLVLLFIIIIQSLFYTNNNYIVHCISYIVCVTVKVIQLEITQ